MKLRDNITLVNGRIVVHSHMANGAQYAEMADGKSMSESEWEEYCSKLAKNAPPARRLHPKSESSANMVMEHITELRADEPNMDAVKTREINILVAENRTLIVELEERRKAMADIVRALGKGMEMLLHYEIAPIVKAVAEKLEKELKQAQEVHDYLVSVNPDNQHLSVLESCIQQRGIENRLRAELKQGATIYPLPLNMAHETAIETFAKDDRLWTTEETVRFNLRTFARVVLRASITNP